jgi:ComF family protein
MKEVKFSLNSFFDRIILDSLYPQRCPICETLGVCSPCENCLQSVAPTPLKFLRPSRDLDEIRTRFVYEAEIVEIIQSLKYHRETSLALWIAEEIRKEYDDWNLDPDWIVPIPIHRSRLAWRGFNQSTLLCEKLPADRLSFDLIRTRRTKPQVLLSAEERELNLKGAFQCRSSLNAKSILLIDDVVTSGATSDECARSLKQAGARWVGLLALAGKRR